MTQILTTRQAEELYGDPVPLGPTPSFPAPEQSTDPGRRHKSVIAYLSANNLSNAAAALRADVGLGEDVFDANTAKKYEGLLEKKWTSVVRLQKKVCPRMLPYHGAALTVLSADNGPRITQRGVTIRDRQCDADVLIKAKPGPGLVATTVTSTA